MIHISIYSNLKLNHIISQILGSVYKKIINLLINFLIIKHNKLIILNNKIDIKLLIREDYLFKAD